MWYFSDEKYKLNNKFIGKAKITHIGIAHYGSSSLKDKIQDDEEIGEIVENVEAKSHPHTL